MSTLEAKTDSQSSPTPTRVTSVFKLLLLAAVLLAVAIVGWRVYRLNRYSELIQQANVMSNSGQHEQVVELIKQAHQIDDTDFSTFRLLAKAQIALKQFSEAKKSIQRITDPMSEDLDQLAMLAANERDWQTCANAWLKLRDQSAQAENKLTQYMSMLQANSKTADLAELCEQLSLQNAAQPDSGYFTPEMILAILNQERGIHGPALQHWKRVYQVYSQSRKVSDSSANESFKRIPVQYAASLLRSGQHQLALKILESESSPESVWLKSRAHLQAGDVASYRHSIDQYKQISSELKPIEYRYAEPAQFVGASKCQPCHIEQSKMQNEAHHADTFGLANLATMSDYLPSDPLPDPEIANSVHEFQQVDDQARPRVHVKSGNKTIPLSFHFRFGSGSRGQTFIVNSDLPEAKLIEYRLSIYQAHGWDITTGQDMAARTTPESDTTPLGRVLHWSDQLNCLRCHNSDPETALNVTPETPPDKLGIRCESCHGPGGNHLKAVELKIHESDSALTQLKKLSARENVRLCASCHQPDQFNENRDPLQPSSARFQTIGLQASQCFKQSENLSCSTCHSPHSRLVRDENVYNAKCINCHQDTAKLTCPTEKLSDGSRSGSCVKCHMATVQGVIRHTNFVDHFIRKPVNQ